MFKLKTMCMKKVKSSLYFGAIAAMAVFAMGLGSCSKSSGTTTPPPPVLIGGYASSDSVASDALITYFPFDADANDKKGGLTTTASPGVTFVTGGIRGSAYQGATGAYATLNPNAALDSLHSYSVSVWYNLAAQPSGTPNDPGGMFFLFSTKANPEIILETEHYAPVSGDSVQIHAGFYNPAAAQWNGWTMTTFDTAAIGKWVHFVMTYDGPSSTYVVYQDGAPTLNSSAFGWNLSSVLTAGPAGATPPSPPLGPLGFSTDLPAQIVIGTWPAGLYGVSATLGANGSYLGKMDELRVFNRAITQHEVAGLYLNGQAGR
jgi:hypothetical protein